MLNSPVELKGKNFTLSVIHLRDANPEDIRQILADKIAQAPAFLKHAPVIINVSNLSTIVSWKHLQQAITDNGLRIVGISGCKDSKLKSEIEHAGLPLLTEGVEKFYYSSKKIQTSLHSQIEKTILIDEPVRSGQQIYASKSDLIVTNHVSAGAELIADGNIHIYGILYGRALAGANGDKDAQIFCINLMAELVSIAGEYWTSDKISSKFYGKAARLRLIDNVLIIQSFV